MGLGLRLRLARGFGERGVGLPATEPFTEVPDPAAEAAPHVREPFRAEDEQRHREDEKQMCWLEDVTDHVVR